MIWKVIIGSASLVLVSLLFIVLEVRGPETLTHQPVAFSHKLHVDRQIDCTFCHDLAEHSTAAGIPGVTQCMLCHRSIHTDRPEIQKVAAFEQRKEEIPWKRIYKFRPQAGVYFSHKRHLKAEITCSRCHGNVAALSEMRLEIRWTMGKCIDCHKERKARIECITCHQ